MIGNHVGTEISHPRHWERTQAIEKMVLDKISYGADAEMGADKSNLINEHNLREDQ